LARIAIAQNTINYLPNWLDFGHNKKKWFMYVFINCNSTFARYVSNDYKSTREEGVDSIGWWS
jgi:hypothetical protein